MKIKNFLKTSVEIERGNLIFNSVCIGILGVMAIGLGAGVLIEKKKNEELLEEKALLLESAKESENKDEDDVFEL